MRDSSSNLNATSLRSAYSRDARWILLLLIFGVFATVLSAWISALAVPIATNAHMDLSSGPWIEPVPEDWPDVALGVTYIARDLNKVPWSLRPIGKQLPASFQHPRSPRLRVRQGFATGISSGPSGNAFFGDDPLHVIDQIRCGWPINTMMTRGPDDARPKSASGIARLYQSGIVVSGAGTGLMRSIPLRPLWGPFVLSVLGWVLVAWILWLCYRMTGVYRRRRWRTMGLCHGCGYAIEDLAVCPECGCDIELDREPRSEHEISGA